MTRFAQLMLAAALPLVAVAQPPPEARFPLDLEPGHSAWRVPLSDAQYAALGAPNFRDVQVVGDAGDALDWALCMRTREQTSRVAVPVTAVPLAGRAQLDVDGRVSLRTGAGFRATEFGSLVLDTRGHGAVRRITVAGWQDTSVTVRLSPDLRQWSNRLPASVNAVDGGLELVLTPSPANFVRLDPAAGFSVPPADVVVDFDDEGVLVETAWYAPPSTGAGSVRHVRALPVQAARVKAGPRIRWTLESRDRSSNSWKPRATGLGDAPVEFSASYDDLWRVRPEIEGLELGHAAYELRVAAAQRPVRAVLVAGALVGGGARLSCDLERWDSAGSARFLAGGAGALAEDRGAEGPMNFRPVFLLVVGLIAVGWIVARLINKRARL